MHTLIRSETSERRVMLWQNRECADIRQSGENWNEGLRSKFLIKLNRLVMSTDEYKVLRKERGYA